LPREASRATLLYNPGDNVETVHFPVRTDAGVLHGSERGRPRRRDHPDRPRRRRRRHRQPGYLPAYTRITVKFGGRSCGCRQQARRGQSEVATLRNVFARYADCMLAQIFQSTACNAIHSIEQRTAKWIISAMERTDGDEVGAAHP
jgi:hypothetical protein